MCEEIKPPNRLDIVSALLEGLITMKTNLLESKESSRFLTKNQKDFRRKKGWRHMPAFVQTDGQSIHCECGLIQKWGGDTRNQMFHLCEVYPNEDQSPAISEGESIPTGRESLVVKMSKLSVSADIIQSTDTISLFLLSIRTPVRSTQSHSK